jgi:hypothetical protein
MKRLLERAALVVLSLSLPLATAGGIKEDFEGYPADASIHKQNGWNERAYGRHPSCKVAKGQDPENQSKILKPFGGGDRHVYKRFPRETFREIIDAPVTLLEFSYQRGTRIELAAAGAYASGKPLALKCGGKLEIFFDKTIYPGALKLAPDGWYDVRLIIERRGNSALVTAAFKQRNQDAYSIDPEINQLKLPLSPAVTRHWNGINVRLDGGSALDEVALASYQTAEEIPGKMNLGEFKLAFEPILDHISPPRKAMSLCGKWTCFVAKDGKLPDAAQAWQTLIIPEQHSQLVNSAGKGCVFFRKTFELAAASENRQVFACFERVTDICEVTVNGHKAGGSTDGHFPFKVNISSFIRSGANTLTVKVLGPKATDAHQNRPQGWTWFHPKFSGIPYPVHLEESADVMVGDVFVKPRVGDTNSLEAEITLRNFGDKARTVAINAFVGQDFRFPRKSAVVPAGTTRTVRLSGNWTSPRLWWPHDPHLYYLTVQLLENETTVDAYKQRFGFRELRVAGEVILLNNRRMLHRRSSIIPYWPRSTKKASLEMFNILKKRGYNGSRLHGGPNLRIIRAADEFGWLLAPESAINEPRGHEVTAAYWPAANEHLSSMVKAFRNNPSVIYWCLSNEFASYYMKGSSEEKAEVDAKMLAFGRMVEKLDPTRTWTCSGDGELGGWGHHGPAPTLSFHYAWQPFKTSNMIPNTVHWLTEGRQSWHGILWDKTKPVMLSEDLYAPYALKPPHGMAQWAGEKAFDPRQGLPEAWYEAYHMLCDGYYLAPVSCWNPWGTSETTPGNPIYAHGQLMPDYHIAIKEPNTTFFSGEKSQREIRVYNQMFRDLECTLKLELLQDGNRLSSNSNSFPLNGGAMKTLNLPLQMPVVSGKTKLQCELTLSTAGKVLTKKIVDYTVYPRNPSFRIPPRTVLVGASLKMPGVNTSYRTLSDALQSKPANLVIADYGQMEAHEGRMLSDAVNAGLNVLWLEVPINGWKPCKIYPEGEAAFSFVRAPEDPCLQGIDNGDLKLWRPKSLATLNAMLKPDDGAYDILIDCFNGLDRTALVRQYAGKGSWLLCQLPIVSSWEQEPAARYVFGRLLAALDKPAHNSGYTLGLLADKDSELEQSLAQVKIPFGQSASANVLMLDGTKPLTASAINAVQSCCKRGGTVLVDGLTAENAGKLGALTGKTIGLKPATAFQLVKHKNGGLLSGLSNGDLYWSRYADAAYQQCLKSIRGQEYDYKGESMLSGEILCSGDTVVSPVAPAGLIVLRHGAGSIILNTVEWRKFLSIKGDCAKRFITTVLLNLDVRVAEGKGIVTYHPVDLEDYANRGFWNRQDGAVKGWFGNGDDDMRYFPVNRTGIDSDQHMPCPLEPFPQEPVNYGGISFKLVDPDKNNGAACVVLAPKQTIRVKLGRKADKLWMLGTLGNHLRTGTKAATVVLEYADGSTGKADIVAGVHLNGYQYLKEADRGIAAWVGKTPKYQDAVLWSWNLDNPAPEKAISNLTLEAAEPLALIGITLEHSN